MRKGTLLQHKLKFCKNCNECGNQKNVAIVGYLSILLCNWAPTCKMQITEIEVNDKV